MFCTRNRMEEWLAFCQCFETCGQFVVVGDCSSLLIQHTKDHTRFTLSAKDQAGCERPNSIWPHATLPNSICMWSVTSSFQPFSLEYHQQLHGRLELLHCCDVLNSSFIRIWAGEVVAARYLRNDCSLILP